MKCSKATQKGNKKMNEQPDLFKSLERINARVAQMKSEKQPEPPKPQAVEIIPLQQAPIVQNQLELFPEDKRQACNAMIRGALFSAVQGENRKLFDAKILPTQNGITIKFSGWQLNQSDHDVLLQIQHLASKPYGETVDIPANAILRGLGRGTGKSQHEQLKKEITRLSLAGVQIKAEGIYFVGGLIDMALQDERKPLHKRHWTIRLTRELEPLFTGSQFTLVDWDKRLKLGQKDLAKWLQLYFDSNVNQYPVSVEWIKEKSGSETKELWHFRTNLKKALDALVEAGFLTAWRIDAGDLVHIEKPYTRSQQRHINSTSKPALPAPTQASLAIMQGLDSRTIEQFRRLYPNKCPHTCNADFACWLEGKDAPQNYDNAFLGFAKKWAFKH
jgi:hypothetical protein